MTLRQGALLGLEVREVQCLGGKREDRAGGRSIFEASLSLALSVDLSALLLDTR